MKQISILISIVFIFSALINVKFAAAAEPVLPGFDPNKLIDDRVFSDTSTFGGSEGIQKFLEDKNSVLANTSQDFLAKLREPTSTTLKESVEDPRAKLSKTRTAAELIWDASQSSGLNPQVILLKLNKEQSLITGRQNSTTEQLQRALDFSMGFGCPDTQPCGELYRGFYFQLFGNVDAENNRYLGAAKSLMKSFSTPGGRGPFYNGATSKVGDTITLGNTLGGYEGVQAQQTITLSNAATAALYRYTPHVFNGNYNFWRFYVTWFKNSASSPSTNTPRRVNGSLIKNSGDTTVYMIQDDKKLKVLPFVATSRNIQVQTAQSVSRSEMRSYADGGLLGLNNDAMVTVDGKYFVFIDNLKRPASTQVILQRGLNPANAISISTAEAKLFSDGPLLTPADNTILRGQTGTSVYLVQNGVLKLFTGSTLAQYGGIEKALVIPDAELELYSKEGVVPPKDGTLIKSASSPAVFVLENSIKKPLSGELFKNLNFSFANIVLLTDAELNAFVTGSMPMPANMTFFKNGGTGENWVYINGGKHKISTFVGTQKQLTPDYTFDASYVDSMTISTPIIPKDGTLIKSDKSAAVYMVQDSVLKPMTFEAFVARKITPKQLTILPQAEVDSYVKGAVIAK